LGPSGSAGYEWFSAAKNQKRLAGIEGRALALWTRKFKGRAIIQAKGGERMALTATIKGKRRNADTDNDEASTSAVPRPNRAA
jgi:hypothetical protein